MTSRVVVKGADDLARGARSLAENIEAAGRDTARIVADQVAVAARATVPRLTGRLAASVIPPRLVDRGVEMGMGEGLPYAGWIEFGGSRGRPLVPEGRYLYGPANAAFDDLVRRLSDVLDDEIKEMSWPRPT